MKTMVALLAILTVVLLAAACGTQPTPIGPTPASCVGLPETEPDACGRFVARVEETHPDETRAASRILVADTCPPRALCDREFLYDAVVLLVPPAGEPTGVALHVYGQQVQQLSVDAWEGALPEHVTNFLEQGWAAGWTPPPVRPPR